MDYAWHMPGQAIGEGLGRSPGELEHALITPRGWMGSQIGPRRGGLTRGRFCWAQYRYAAGRSGTASLVRSNCKYSACVAHRMLRYSALMGPGSAIFLCRQNSASGEQNTEARPRREACSRCQKHKTELRSAAPLTTGQWQFVRAPRVSCPAQFRRSTAMAHAHGRSAIARWQKHNCGEAKTL